MKYREMVELANNKNLDTTKIEIAQTVDALLEQVAEETKINITDDEFEDICDNVYESYDDCQEYERVDIDTLVTEELESRGYWYED